MLVLGIETSCDETAAAVVEAPHRVLSNLVATQVPVHARYGGIVPELASRNHVASILPVVQMALDNAGVQLRDVGLIAVTQGPGLMGSLLVGTQTAKALALATEIPIVGVDHIEAHATAAWLSRAPRASDAPPEYPYIALVVSGGHTAIYEVGRGAVLSVLGHTLDDAAGEAFDKVARLVGLPYPGGAAIDQLAEQGDCNSVELPRSWLSSESLDFSFSGLKTAARLYVQTHFPEGIFGAPLANLAASVREAVVDVLVDKTIRAAEQRGATTIVVGGGVAANRRLRNRLEGEAAAKGLRAILTPLPYCGDNGAMIAHLGWLRWRALGEPPLRAQGLGWSAYPNLRMGSPRTKKVKRPKPMQLATASGA